MARTSTVPLTLTAAALLVACGGNPPPGTPAPQSAEAMGPPPHAAEAALSDERAMELGRRYVALVHARDFDALWQHLTPERRERFGSLDRFRSQGERLLGELGRETAVVSERVEPARAGGRADKLYFRVSHYTGAEGAPAELMIGLKNDGTIAGLELRPSE